MIECSSIQEVRNHIDQIDDQIVQLISKRSHYVYQAMKFKNSLKEVNVPSRNQEVIQRVRRLSKAHHLDPEIAERIYQVMIEEFILFQQKEMLKRTNQHEP